MQSLILFCTFFQAIYLGTADEKLSYGQDGGITSVLLKKIWDLEEHDRGFDRKLQEIDVLKERLDEAHRRLANMQKLEARLQNAEDRIRMLINRVENNNVDCKVNKSAAMKSVDTNMDINSSDSFWMRLPASKLESRHADLGTRHVGRVTNNNGINIVQNIAATKDIKRTITRKAAFTAMFLSGPVAITPGRTVLFDRVDYNEGNAYDAKIGIFTCPVSGTYFFFTDILSMSNSGSVQTEIVLEGLGRGRTHAFSESDFSQGSTAAAVHCDAGQRVWIQGVYGSRTFGEMYSSFSGILLWPSDASTNSN